MDILGQPQVIHYLSEGLKRGILSPSLLFIGPDGVGKKLCAFKVAKHFCCTGISKSQVVTSACGSCRPCVQITNINHADVLYIDRLLQAQLLREKPETQTSIKIDSVRHAEKFLSFKPLEGERRIVIIDEAHKLGVEAANALLKLLEEPPNRAQIILIANDEHALPQTVVSRCAVVRFRSIPSKIIADWLEKEHAVSESLASEIADQAGGSFEKALKIKNNDRPSTDLSDYTLDEFFTLLSGTHWKKDARKQAEAAITHLIESAQKKLHEDDFQQVDRLKILLSARTQINRNVPAKLVLENLFVKLELNQ